MFGTDFIILYKLKGVSFSSDFSLLFIFINVLGLKKHLGNGII